MAHNCQRRRGLLVACFALFLLAPPAFAGGEQNPSATTSVQSSGPPADFLLGRPRATVGLRGSFMRASANSDLFDFVTSQLSIDKSDFNTGSFGAELGISLTQHLDIVGAWDVNAVDRDSDYRKWQDNRGLPIQQSTQLEQMNLTVSAKLALLPRGRNISRLAWIPRTVVPYVGAGGGYGKYKFRQNGDFIDTADLHVFPDTFVSTGWAPTFHVLGGTDVRVYKRLIMSFEGRYSWSNATLSQDFVDFEPIDLGGFRFGAGIHLAF